MNDSIAFDKAQIEELSSNYNTISGKLENSIGEITASLTNIKNNWKGPERDSAEGEFQSSNRAMEGITNNLSSIGKILSDATSEFRKVKY